MRLEAEALAAAEAVVAAKWAAAEASDGADLRADVARAARHSHRLSAVAAETPREASAAVRAASAPAPTLSNGSASAPINRKRRRRRRAATTAEAERRAESGGGGGGDVRVGTPRGGGGRQRRAARARDDAHARVAMADFGWTRRRPTALLADATAEAGEYDDFEVGEDDPEAAAASDDAAAAAHRCWRRGGGSGEVAVSDAAAGDGDDEALVDASDYDDDDDEYDEAEAAAIELEMELEDPEILAEAEASARAAEENYATCDDQPGADPEQALDDSRAAMEDFLLNHKRKSGIAAAAIASLERSLRATRRCPSCGSATASSPTATPTCRARRSTPSDAPSS